MELQIVIFLAFISVTLVFNTAIIWFAYKAFANITLRITGSISEIRASDETKGWIDALQSASVQAVTITDTTRDRIHAFEPVLERAESRLSYGLAKFDIRVEALCENISKHTETAQRKVEEPCHKIGSGMRVVGDLLERFSPGYEQSGDDATATPSK